MRVAVVGTGIAGLVAARELASRHDVTVFEANDYVGGHSHTHEISVAGREVAVDTGFIVFNRRTYPGFSGLLDELGVVARPTEMSFSVRCEATGLEYCGSSLNGLFAQRRNLLRPHFHRMLREIVRFQRVAKEWLETAPVDELTLGDFLERYRFEGLFVSHYLVPMGAAIWSAPAHRMQAFPARSLLGFFANHGLLSLADRPQWYVVEGGSRRYVDRLIAPFRHRIRLSSPVRYVRREGARIEVAVRGHAPERFDEVVLATHADQALELRSDADPEEREVLRALPYQENEVVLHTDGSLLPRLRRARAAWNYLLPARPQERVSVTYCMNVLQGLDVPEPVCVTLNRSRAVNPDKVIRRLVYQHPLFDRGSRSAQQRLRRLNGRGGIHFCGAYCGYGFHEDGFQSGLAVATAIVERRQAA